MPKSIQQQLDDALSALHAIDEFRQMGLNSDKPEHWEAALQDIGDILEKARVTS